MARLFHSGLGRKDGWGIRATGVAGHNWNEFASIFNALSAHGKLLTEEGNTLALALPLSSLNQSQHQKSHQDWQCGDALLPCTEMGIWRHREEQSLRRALPLMRRKPEQLMGVHTSATEGEDTVMPATWGRAEIMSWKRKTGGF